MAGIAKCKLDCGHYGEYSFPYPEPEDIIYCLKCGNYATVYATSKLPYVVKCTKGSQSENTCSEIHNFSNIAAANRWANGHKHECTIEFRSAEYVYTV